VRQRRGWPGHPARRRAEPVIGPRFARTRWRTRIGHADIAVACALRFTGEAHAGVFDDVRHPALAAHAARCEALPLFAEIVQPLAPPGGD
jgi:glutathione S-transferase